MRQFILTICVLLAPIVLFGQETKDAEKKSSAAADEKLRQELLQMVKEDQDVRMKLLDLAKSASRDPKKLGDLPEIKKLRDLDKKNTEQLKALVVKHGWPGKSLVGVDGAHAAWLLVQHADHDRPFQKKCLTLMEAAAKKGEVTKADVAYLVDRVLIGEGKKQRYGTQFKQEKNDWVPQLIEDEVNVDKRRAEVGLPSLAEYKKMVQDAYKPKEEKK
jgi:hypothetical protein